eukprot:scaffold34110_cov74-Phaeocystis_antarctica.AAC.2
MPYTCTARMLCICIHVQCTFTCSAHANAVRMQWRQVEARWRRVVVGPERGAPAGRAPRWSPPTLPPGGLKARSGVPGI